MATGLQAILTSRIDPVRKNKALHLAAMLTHLLGVTWAVQTNTKFFMIIVNLVSVVSGQSVVLDTIWFHYFTP